MHLNTVGQLWLRRYTSVLACCTFLLVIAGGLVTSNEAAGSIPDWPLSWGRVVPILEGGIRYEFAHRVAALIVTLLTALLAFRLRTRLAWTALGTVLAQASLGGVLVRYLDPKAAAIAHAALAQFFFGLTVLLWLSARNTAPARSLASVTVPVAAVAALFAQTILGASVRHGVVGPVAHVCGAILATALVMWAAFPVLIYQMDNSTLRRPAMILLSITFSQVFLGIGAWMSRLANLNAPQPMPLMVLFTVAHVAVGSLAFGASLALTDTLRRNAPLRRSLSSEGMATA
jgi:cytochrome c oxidase assembly protein subunit 15